MATELFKLKVYAETTTDTNANPEVVKYFYTLSESEIQGSTITIPATEFVDDDGNPVTENLLTVNENNGYYLLFINGVLQQSSLYTVSTDGSNVVITEGDTVPIGAPIVLVVNNFAPESTSTTTVIT
ncbi:DUF4183 domain-containing protein [Alkalithermobacter paradoxus]|uniref:DUF4183 domain-containing protein n=1 Tax=Alkalithermobacter paradoxus TaxID=29349 RepID=A0A1V4I8I1_9FIRM|nr:hypothetical protein CLOTH_06370 [[Clostridium] thermoalcaliphilum]